MPSCLEIPQVNTNFCDLQYILTMNLWYNFSCIYFYKGN